MPDANDMSRRFQVVKDEDHHVEVNLKVRLTRKVKIAAVLLGASMTPVTIFAGAIPWGARLAGMATKQDMVDVKDSIAKQEKAQQTADAIDAVKAAKLNNELEGIRSSISLLGDKVKSLGFKINKRINGNTSPKEQSGR